MSRDFIPPLLFSRLTPILFFTLQHTDTYIIFYRTSTKMNVHSYMNKRRYLRRIISLICDKSRLSYFIYIIIKIYCNKEVTYLCIFKNSAKSSKSMLPRSV